MSIKRSTIFAQASLAVLSSLVAGSAEAGDATIPGSGTGGGTGGGTVQLQTYSTKVYNATLPRAKVSKLTGSGAVDTDANWYPAPNGETLLGMVWTASDDTTNNNSNNSYFRGMFGVSKITAAGVVPVVQPTMIAKLNGDRAFMRPRIVFANGGKHMVLIAAAEENGINNGNPQVVTTVIDAATGATMKITNGGQNRSTFRQQTFMNLITQSGNNDNQQYGPHSICQVSDNEILTMVQRNNQNQYALLFQVNDAGAGAVTITAKRRLVIQNAQHSRGMIACPLTPPTARVNELVVTSVEANNQPADIGIRVGALDTSTLSFRTSKLAVASSPRQNIYAVQPNITYLGGKYVGLQYQISNKTATRNGGNQHKGGNNKAYLEVLDATTLTSVDKAEAVSASARHSDACGTTFGADGAPAVGVISGAATGTGAGLVQIHPVDPATGKIADVDRVGRLFQVSKFADVSGNAVRGKRNPNDQGRGFIRCVGGAPNPGFGQPNGFLADVKTFTVSLVQGFENGNLTTATQDEPQHAFLSLVPASWKAGVAAVPGPVVNTPPLGPSPVVAGGTSTGSAGDGTSGYEDRDSNGDTGYDMDQGGGQGNSCSTSGTNPGSAVGLFAAVGLALSSMMRRRRGTK